MKMRMTWVLLVACLLAVPASGQKPHLPEGGLGFKLGYWHSNLTSQPVNPDKGAETVGEWQGSVGGGLFVLTPLSAHLGLQVELLYCRKGSAATISGEREEIQLTYLDLPFLLRYSAGPGDFLAEAGISVGIPLSQKFIQDDIAVDLGELDRADVCALLGLGFDLDWGQVGIRYAHGIRNLDQPGMTRIRTRSWTVMTGIMF